MIFHMPQGNAFSNYLNNKQWPMPKSTDVFRSTKTSKFDEIVAPLGFSVAFRLMLHRSLYK